MTHVQRLLLLFVLAALCLAAWPLAILSATEPADPVLVRMSTADYEAAASAEIEPHRVLDYGAFVWLELPAGDLAWFQAAEVRYEVYDAPYVLRLGGRSFDPVQQETGGSAGLTTGLHLVQFVGPTRGEWLAGLETAGLQVVQYVHPFTYVVWGQPAALERAASTAAARWTGPFEPEYRLLPRWQSLSDEPVRVSVLMVRYADVEAAIQAIEGLGAELEGRGRLNDVFEVAGFRLPGSQLPAAARIPGVYSIQPEPTDGGLRGEMSNQINVNNHDAGNLAFPGYPSWLSAAGVDGSGVVIANVDGGVADGHPDLVSRLLPCSGTTCGGSASSDHGTHTAGIMAADGSSGVVDGYGFLRGQGMAPGAGLVEQVYYPYYTWSNGMLLLMTDSYRNGASLSGNSWGPSDTPRGYDADTLQVDIGVRDADPGAAGNQPLSYVLSFMNGYGGYQSQGTPDEAKNILTVGSTKMQTTSGAQYLSIDDLSANTAHGPALDGRTIPHLVAPGCSVDSTVPGSHGLKCGTSMASPHASGAVALFIERYRGLFGVDPSPALVKAAFLPVAHDLAGHNDADGGTLGHPFDAKQGWGRLDVEAVVSPTLPVLYYDAPLIFDDSGEAWVRKVLAADPGQPVRLMLVWTDAPGHGLGGTTPAWNNDLDLVVEFGGETYRGNNFGPDGWSQAGGAADGMNNTEGVFLAPGILRQAQDASGGAITIRVVAANISSDGVPHQGDTTDQDFALACYNCLADSDFALSVQPDAFAVCAPEVVSGTVQVEQIADYAQEVMLAVGSVPAGVAASISPASVAPPGTAELSLDVGAAASDGDYQLVITGTSEVSNVHTARVDLWVGTDLPLAPDLVYPPNGATEVPRAEIIFEWSAQPGATSYHLQMDDDPAFASPLVDVTGLASPSYRLAGPLEPSTTYYWRARAVNACGEGAFSGTSSFTVATLGCILLVDDDNNSPDVQPYYASALDALGYTYDVFDVGGGSADGPKLVQMARYPIVVWFSGHQWGGLGSGEAGPNETDEGELAAYLEGGGKLFLSSQDYLYDFDLTSFGQDYLGIESFVTEAGDATDKYGVGGDPIGGGLGPYPLSYPLDFTDYGDVVNAGAGASVAFRSSADGGNNLDVDKDGGAWRTVFFGTSWVPVYHAEAANGEEVLNRIVDWFGGCTCASVHDADFTWLPAAPSPGQMVDFYATAQGDAPFAYSWDFGDGGVGAGPVVTHTFATTDTYNVVLTATNCLSGQISVTKAVPVGMCQPPQVLALTHDSPVALGQPLHLSATVTGTGPLTYTWDFGGAGTGSGLDTLTPVFTYTAAGDYLVTLVVAGPCGIETLTETVTVGAGLHNVYLPLVRRKE